MIERYTKDERGVIDELVATRAAVHLEQLNKRDWMLIVESCGKRVHLTVRNVTEVVTEGFYEEREEGK